MLPGMVMSLRLVSVGRTTITLAWARPDLGTGQLLHYEYEVGTGIWVTTQSTAETVTIMGLTPDTPYALRIRARTTVGRGPSSQTLPRADGGYQHPRHDTRRAGGAYGRNQPRHYLGSGC